MPDMRSMVCRIYLETYLLLFSLPAGLSAQIGENMPALQPAAIWNDTEGRPINAHGGGILFYEGVYYWYGEIKQGRTWRVPGVSSWEDYRVSAGRGGLRAFSYTSAVEKKR